MKTETARLFRTLLLALIPCTLLAAQSARSQTGSGSPAPTYDYDANTPGTQGPTSPLLADYDYRSVRTYQVAIPVLVPLTQMQALMPPGFTATPSSAGAKTASLSLTFFVDQRFTYGGHTYGPVSALLATTTAVNNNVTPARSEIVFPSFEASGDTDELNAAFGAGAARKANVKVQVEQVNGLMHFGFDVTDPGLGFKISADAISSSDINNRVISDPVGLPFRAFTGKVADIPFRAASQSDTLAVPVEMAHVKLQAPGHRLRCAGGTLQIVGFGPTVTFSRGVEFIIKFEQPAG